MEIKSSDLQQPKVNSRDSARGTDTQRSAPAENRPQPELSVETKIDRVSISDQAKLVASRLEAPSEDAGAVQSKEDAANLARSIADSFSQKPKESLASNDPIPRERISNLISREPQFTQEAEPAIAREKASQVAQQVSQQPRAALESQANGFEA